MELSVQPASLVDGVDSSGLSAPLEVAFMIIHVKGELDSNTSGELDNTLKQLLGEGSRRFILELSEMDYVSSVGLRVFLAHLKKLKSDQGRMVLAGLNAEVQEIFDMAGFSSLFEITPDLEAARSVLRS
ncbi:MAG: STAS domain-containing protein [Cyanobacteria bacterium]|nr:STAS domain-containing protein [Cyanobacteriota bacterium]